MSSGPGVKAIQPALQPTSISSEEMKGKLIRAAITILVPVVIFLAPVPADLPVAAWRLFAIYIGAILGMMLRPVPEAVVLLVAIAISGIFLKNTTVVLAGFASPTAWLVFSAFMLGQAFIETGLGKRIAFLLIGTRLGRTTLGLGYVAAFTDLIISPATPSNTARTGGLVYPIFRSLAVTLGSEPGPTSRRIGGYLSLLLYQISITTAHVFLTASATNLIVTTFAKSILKVDVSWMQWSQALTPPALFILMLLPWIVYKLYPPEIKQIDNSTISERGLTEMGPATRREKTLACLFVLAIIGWATGNLTKVDATAVAIGFVAACLVTGVVSWNSLASAKGAWSILMWYGGIISLADGLAKAGFFIWLAKIISRNFSFAGYSTFTMLLILLLLSCGVRYFFASLAPFCTTFIPVLFTIGLVANVPKWPLIFLMGAASEFGCLLTHYSNAVAPVLFSPGYVGQATWWKVGHIIAFICGVIYMTLGLGYWKLLGLW
jgi:DASS family divalent anion:Na+ symporter